MLNALKWCFGRVHILRQQEIVIGQILELRSEPKASLLERCGLLCSFSNRHVVELADRALSAAASFQLIDIVDTQAEEHFYRKEALTRAKFIRVAFEGARVG